MTDQLRVIHAVSLATRYGGINGEHHKTWVIDQMVRALMTDDAYKQWVVDYGEDGEDSGWDVGIAP